MGAKEIAEELKSWGDRWGNWVGPKGDEARYKRMAECAYAGSEAVAERDQLRAEVEDIRQQRDYWQEEAVEMRRYKEASESLVAGLRGALELLLKCNALGVAIPWGKAVSALAEADRLEKEAANGK